jgi:tRNA splicing ligase
MKRQLIALIVMLALGLQGSLVALAAIAPQMADCQTPVESQDVAHKSCCPSGIHTASCCLDACLSAVAVTMSPASMVWNGRTVRALLFRTATFSSRGDSPLIRPPIL